ncbi:MAG: hypothetical protein AAF449_07660, partial [Myxococcota bacterium]
NETEPETPRIQGIGERRPRFAFEQRCGVPYRLMSRPFPAHEVYSFYCKIISINDLHDDDLKKPGSLCSSENLVT